MVQASIVGPLIGKLLFVVGLSFLFDGLVSRDSATLEQGPNLSAVRVFCNDWV